MMRTYQWPLKKIAIGCSQKIKKIAIGHLLLLMPAHTTYATVILLHCFLLSKPSQVDISHKNLAPRIFTLNLDSVYYTHLIIYILTHFKVCMHSV